MVVVVVVTTGDPPPVDGAVVVVVETTAPPPPVEGAVVVVVVVLDPQGLLRLQPLVPLFLGSTPTARRASANTPTATAPRMMLRRRLAARSPVESFDPVARSVGVMVSSVRSMCCGLSGVCSALAHCQGRHCDWFVIGS